MTSLQKQLASIAASSTHQLDLKAQRVAHSKSLIYEARVAATQDFDTIYQICYEGFQELCGLDARFVRFRDNLFSESSKSEDRTQMTVTENAELDKVLESFLGLLGPRLLLKPAVKALEWGIRRFRVHEYNTKFLIITFLPFHTTQIFATLLSILPSEIPRTFRFLYPYMSSLVNPPRHALVYAAIQNVGFFSAVNDYVLEAVRARNGSTLFLSFWTSLATQAVNGMLDLAAASGRTAVRQEKQEDVLLRVLPVINDGLAIAKSPDLILGCYALLTVIASKADLEDEVLDTLMEGVVRSWTTTTIDAGLVCLSVLSHERTTAKLPKRVTKGFLMIDDLADRVLLLMKDHRMDRLTLGTVLGSVDIMDESNCRPTLDDINQYIHSDVLNARQEVQCISAVLRRAETLGKTAEFGKGTHDGLDEFFERLRESSKGERLLHEVTSSPEIDIRSLELKLGSVISLPRESQDNEGQDHEMLDIQFPPRAADLSATLSTIPQSTDVVSFLQYPRSETFDILRNAFIQSLKVPNGEEAFLDLPILDRDHLETPRLLTFLASVWCGSDPISVRAGALDVATKSLLASGDSPLDFQALFPYILSALADASLKVRRAAAHFVNIIRSVCVKSTQKHDKNQTLRIWGQNNLYGRLSKNVKWLQTKDSLIMLDRLLAPHTDEYILDAGQIVRVINTALGGSTDENDKIKRSLRTLIFQYLSTHIACTPLQVVKLCLLRMLSGVGKAGAESRRDVIIPSFMAWAKLPEREAKSLCEKERINASDLDREYLAVLNLREETSMLCLQDIVRGNVGDTRDSLQRAAFIHLQKAWSSLKPATQGQYADFLLEQSFAPQSSTGSKASQEEAAATLRSLQLSSDILLNFLQMTSDLASMSNSSPSAKRRKTNESVMIQVQSENAAASVAVLQKFTFVLELVEASEPKRHVPLLKSLFTVLGNVQHLKTQMHSDLAYLESLTLSSLLALVEELRAQGRKADRSDINADLVVHCLRSTSSPAVRNAALLLISSLAKHVPDQVLHSIMPIFTFMSSNVMKQGDDYSAFVIQNTVQKVIPTLVESLRKKGQDLVNGAAELFLSFAAAFQHVPQQRRMALYQLLVRTLGVEESLFAIVTLLIDRHPEDQSVRSFVKALVSQHDVTVQLQTVRRCVELCSDALQPKLTLSDSLLSDEGKDPNRINNSLTTLLDTLSSLLTDQHLRNNISMALRRTHSAEAIKKLYAALLGDAIKFWQRVANRENISVACKSFVECLLNLLPDVYLIEAAIDLLENPDEQVRRSVIRALERRIRVANRDDEAIRKAVLNLLPRLLQTLQSPTDVLTKHAVVACIDQISERYGKKDTAAIQSAAQVILSEQCLASSDVRLQVISLLCLASMVEVLRDEFIPLLPQVFSTGHECLNRSMSEGLENEQLLNAVFSLAIAVLEYLPYMFTGEYLDGILRLAHRSSVSTAFSDEATESRLQLYRLVAQRVELKECLRAVKATWDSALQQDTTALREHVNILRSAIDTNSKSSVLRNAAALFDVALEAFDLRRKLTASTSHEKWDEEDLKRTEECIDKAMIAIVMKLNDASFRPFYLRLVDWVTKGLPKKDKKGRLARLTTFFIFLQTFFGVLKSIVTSYSSYVIEPAVSALQTASVAETDGRRLWEAVLRALKQSFEHDQDDFWQAPSHFSSVMTPLVSQLSKASSRTAPGATSLTTDVYSTITELAVAAASIDQRKELNSAIMALMRSESPDIRLAAVKCEQALTERLGEEWLELLSEMLPFISELQQDDDEDVERETMRWIRKIEEILGESLDPMLA